MRGGLELVWQCHLSHIWDGSRRRAEGVRACGIIATPVDISHTSLLLWGTGAVGRTGWGSGKANAASIILPHARLKRGRTRAVY